MDEYVEVARTDEVPPGEGRVVSVNGHPVALFNVEGEFHAIDGTCTHKGGPLGEGALRGAEVTCPWHGARFDVTTGEVRGPPAPRAVRSYAVKVEGGRVLVAAGMEARPVG